MTSGRTRLGIVFGGASTEHAVSVRSARAVMGAIDPERFEIVPFGITRQGAWMRPSETQELLDLIDGGAPEEVVGAEGVGVLARPQALETLASVEVAFPLVHGQNGEDGSLQGLFELADLPYVGSGVAASAVGMDKELTKTMIARTGIQVVPYRLLTRHDWLADPQAVARDVADLGYPLFTKPANGGSSVGISKVHSREELAPAIEDAFHHDRRILIEQGIDGREIECAVLGNEDPEASPLGEITFTHEFYDYDAKYADAGTTLIAPADLPASVADTIRAQARAAFQAIDCAGMARVDFFVDADYEIWLNEINTIPGFTDVSMFPRLWTEAGLDFASLIARLVDLAFARHEETHHVA
jgi:D-alanine-D-alanine ligase